MRSITLVNQEKEVIFYISGMNGVKYSISKSDIANSLTTFGVYGMISILLEKDWINKDLLLAFKDSILRDHPDSDIDWNMINTRVKNAFLLKDETTYYTKYTNWR